MTTGFAKKKHMKYYNFFFSKNKLQCTYLKIQIKTKESPKNLHLAKESILHNYLHVRNVILQGLMLCVKKRIWSQLAPLSGLISIRLLLPFPSAFYRGKTRFIFQDVLTCLHGWPHFNHDPWAFSDGLKLGFSGTTQRLNLLRSFYNPGHHWNCTSKDLTSFHPA